MNYQSSAATAPNPASGRRYLWAGLGLAVLAVGLGIGQYALPLLVVPWQVPAVTTIGALLLLLSISHRRSVTRILAFIVVAALAGLQWFFMISMSRLPDYTGPARAGVKIPAFQTTLADGRSFTDGDLHDGTASVLTFFRGRW